MRDRSGKREYGRPLRGTVLWKFHGNHARANELKSLGLSLLGRTKDVLRGRTGAKEWKVGGATFRIMTTPWFSRIRVTVEEQDRCIAVAIEYLHGFLMKPASWGNGIQGMDPFVLAIKDDSYAQLAKQGRDIDGDGDADAKSYRRIIGDTCGNLEPWYPEGPEAGEVNWFSAARGVDLMVSWHGRSRYFGGTIGEFQFQTTDDIDIGKYALPKIYLGGMLYAKTDDKVLGAAIRQVQVNNEPVDYLYAAFYADAHSFTIRRAVLVGPEFRKQRDLHAKDLGHELDWEDVSTVSFTAGSDGRPGLMSYVHFNESGTEVAVLGVITNNDTWFSIPGGEPFTRYRAVYTADVDSGALTLVQGATTVTQTPDGHDFQWSRTITEIYYETTMFDENNWRTEKVFRVRTTLTFTFGGEGNGNEAVTETTATMPLAADYDGDDLVLIDTEQYSHPRWNRVTWDEVIQTATSLEGDDGNPQPPPDPDLPDPDDTPAYPTFPGPSIYWSGADGRPPDDPPRRIEEIDSYTQDIKLKIAGQDIAYGGYHERHKREERESSDSYPAVSTWINPVITYSGDPRNEFPQIVFGLDIRAGALFLGDLYANNTSTLYQRVRLYIGGLLIDSDQAAAGTPYLKELGAFLIPTVDLQQNYGLSTYPGLAVSTDGRLFASGKYGDAKITHLRGDPGLPLNIAEITGNDDPDQQFTRIRAF